MNGFLSLLVTVLLSASGISQTPAPHKSSVSKKTEKWLKEHFEYVPSGSVIMDKDTLSVQAFYMTSTEVTNGQYQEFLQDLKRKGETEKLKVAQVDSAKWTTFGRGNLETFAQYYHKHPAYAEFPVVNVSKEGAMLYCAWLTEKLDRISGGASAFDFRLPHRAEFLRAASPIYLGQIYAWGTYELTNKEGCYLANYVHVGDQSVTRNPETGELELVFEPYASDHHSDGAFVTATAKSYFPNDFGFYNLNGNVAEMVGDGTTAVGGDWHSPGFDVRNQSKRTVSEPEPTTGFRVAATFLVSQQKKSK